MWHSSRTNLESLAFVTTIQVDTKSHQKTTHLVRETHTANSIFVGNEGRIKTIISCGGTTRQTMSTTLGARIRKRADMKLSPVPQVTRGASCWLVLTRCGPWLALSPTATPSLSLADRLLPVTLCHNRKGEREIKRQNLRFRERYRKRKGSKSRGEAGPAIFVVVRGNWPAVGSGNAGFLSHLFIYLLLFSLDFQ